MSSLTIINVATRGNGAQEDFSFDDAEPVPEIMAPFLITRDSQSFRSTDALMDRVGVPHMAFVWK